VSIAVIDQRVEKCGCVPDRLFALVQTEILLLFLQNVVEGLIFVIQLIEVGYTRICLRVILAKFLLGLTLAIAALQEFVPLFHIGA